MKKLDKITGSFVVMQGITFLILFAFTIILNGCKPSRGDEESFTSNNGSSQDPDPRILENRRELRNYILSCNVPPATPTKPLSMDLEESIAEPDENGIYHPCYYETWSEVTDLDEIVSLNPNNNVIWPGAVVQGKSFINGSPALINFPRKPGKITVSGLVFDDNLPNSLVVDHPSEGNVKQAISNLIRRPVISTEGSFYYTSHQTYSAEHSLQSIGLSSSWMWGELSSQLNSLDYKQNNNFVVKLTQKYYSVSFEDPSTPEDVFSDSVKVENAKLYMQSGNPPALITNVNYGRIIILSFSTTQDSKVFKAALDASFNSWGARGSVNMESENSEILSSSEIKIFAVGGSSEKIARIITGEEGKSKIDVLREYIDHGGNFSLYSPGSPIGYKANYLSNNGIAAISSSTKFKKLIRCDYVPYRKPLRVTVDKLFIFDVEDDDEDMDFGYEIQFLGIDDKIVDKFANSAFDIYVEEPGKLGGEREGRNVFFKGQTKTVNAPIFKVKCIVWARSRDGDSNRPWKHGARQERIYELAEFVNPPAFVPWNSMRLSISMQ